MKDLQPRTLGRADTVSLVLFIASGVAITALTIWHTVVRIAEIVSGDPLQVPVNFIDTQAEVSTATDSFTVGVDQGILTVEGLTPIGTVPGVIGQVCFALTIAGVVTCLIALSRNIARGRVFSRGNTRLVAGAGLSALVGTATSAFFTQMLSNAAVAQVTDGSFRTAVISVEPFTFILGAFALALVITAFVVGARLQRETEGLV